MTPTKQRRATSERLAHCPDCGATFHETGERLADVEAAYLAWIEAHECEGWTN